MAKNCLNCKYEPDWGKWSKGEYPRCSGACKWDSEAIERIPSTYQISIKHVIRHSDDSGVMRNCPCWESK